MRREKGVRLLVLVFFLGGCGQMTSRQQTILRDAAIGTLFGAGIGAITIAGQSDQNGTRYALGLGVGALSGALIGGLIGYYFAEKPESPPPSPPPANDE